ncbi:MAG: hypothetical protein ACRDLN_08035 [Solirubrobacteraceae bacterium]
MGSAGNAALTAVRRRIAIRRRLATTPGRLWSASALLLIGAIVFGAVAADAARTRRHAVRDIAATERLLVSAVDLSAILSDAHATAASSFLVGGPEPAASRIRYADLLRDATDGVTRLAGELGPSPAVRTIARLLPVYAGLIERARANYRQGFPVGSAYLRRASETRDEILLQGRALYGIQAMQLTESLRTGKRTSALRAVLLAGGAMLALLAATQVYLARTTRRLLNPGLALATVLLLGLIGWLVLAFAAQQRALTQAQRNGTDPIELLTATRILALRAQAEESIALAARGGGEGEPNLADVDRGFEALTAPIGNARADAALGSGGLLHAAAEMAGPTAQARSAIDAIHRAYGTYVEAHERVASCERVGNFDAAVELAVGRTARRTRATQARGDGRNCGPADDPASTADDPVSTKRAAIVLNDRLEREVDAARARFDRSTSRAESALAGLAVGAPVLTGLCALLGLLGVSRRLREYR